MVVQLAYMFEQSSNSAGNRINGFTHMFQQLPTFHFSFDTIGDGTTPPHLFQPVSTRHISTRHIYEVFQHNTSRHNTSTKCFNTTRLDTTQGGNADSREGETPSQTRREGGIPFSPRFYSHKRGFPASPKHDHRRASTD